MRKRIESNWGLIADFLLPCSRFVSPKAHGRSVAGAMRPMGVTLERL